MNNLYYLLITILLIFIFIFLFLLKKYKKESIKELKLIFPTLKNHININFKENEFLATSNTLKLLEDEKILDKLEESFMYEGVITRDFYSGGVSTSQLGPLSIVGNKRITKKGYGWTKIGKGYILITNRSIRLISDKVIKIIYINAILGIEPINKKEINIYNYKDKTFYRVKFKYKYQSLHFADLIYSIQTKQKFKINENKKRIKKRKSNKKEK